MENIIFFFVVHFNLRDPSQKKWEAHVLIGSKTTYSWQQTRERRNKLRIIINCITMMSKLTVSPQSYSTAMIIIVITTIITNYNTYIIYYNFFPYYYIIPHRKDIINMI